MDFDISHFHLWSAIGLRCFTPDAPFSTDVSKTSYVAPICRPRISTAAPPKLSRALLLMRLPSLLVYYSCCFQLCSIYLPLKAREHGGEDFVDLSWEICPAPQ
jgi:hypothetical protein